MLDPSDIAEAVIAEAQITQVVDDRQAKERPESGDFGSIDSDQKHAAAPNIRDIRRTAMDLLARREHSRLELARKLHKRYSEYELIESALDKLTTDSLLSDDRFAEAYVSYRKRAGFGPVRISAELRERGVSELLISRHINDSEAFWTDAALAAKNKKFGSEKITTIEEKARQQRFLTYRGFRHNHFAELLG